MLVSASQDRCNGTVGNQLVFKFDYINLVGAVKTRNVKYRILLIKNVQLLAMLLANIIQTQ
jgi:hypothetical protein